ncbi:MAG TPA: hypothetical protein VKA30_03305 [Actinomycetota bacterium]|nr:hypothetical protein [Actinomycetota bacterium]
MNWNWTIRARDAGMNGLEFTRCTTAGGFTRVLIHAAPAKGEIEVIADDGQVVASGRIDRDGRWVSPMSLIELRDDEVTRTEIWPTDEHVGMLVLLAGGEAAVLQRWEHADDQSWWRWSVEFSNHKGRPADWAPEGQAIQR